jgi:hypothetical protein
VIGVTDRCVDHADRLTIGAGFNENTHMIAAILDQEDKHTA